MEIIIVLIPLAILLGSFFLVSFIWSARRGQYDDLQTPGQRMLLDDKKISQLNSTEIKERK